MLLTLLIACLAIVSCTGSQTCPKVTPVNDFNITTISTGIWHEIARYQHPVEKPIKCISYIVEPLENGFKAETLDIPRDSSEFITAIGEVVPDANGRGMAYIKLTPGNSKTTTETPVINYLYVDPDDLFVAYGCDYNEQDQSLTEFSWIFSRTSQLSSETQAKIDHILEFSETIDRSKYIWIDRSEC